MGKKVEVIGMRVRRGRHKEIEVDQTLFLDVMRSRSLGETLLIVTLAAVLFYARAWAWAAIASIFGLILLATFIFSARGTFEKVLTGFFFFSLMAIVILGSAAAYLSLEVIFPESGKTVSSYQDALYFSIITWTTVGYGDIKPSAAARPWAAGEALYGSIYMGLFVAYIIRLLDNWHYRETQPTGSGPSAENLDTDGKPTRV